MSVGRNIGISILVLVALVVAAVVYIMSSLDTLVAGAIQKYGSQVTQTPVRVSSLSIDLQAGAASIDNLSVGNPDGFTLPNVFTLAGISTRLDVASLGDDPIVIEEVRIDKPSVFYEINNSGASNIKVLQNNIAQSTGGGTAEAESSDSAGPGLIIRQLVIEGGELEARVAALAGKTHTASLPRIQLNNIGEKSGGASGAEVARQVINAVIGKVGPAVAELGLEKYVGKSVEEARTLLEDKVGGQVGGAIEEKSKEGAESLKKLFGQ